MCEPPHPDSSMRAARHSVVFRLQASGAHAGSLAHLRLASCPFALVQHQRTGEMTAWVKQVCGAEACQMCEVPAQLLSGDVVLLELASSLGLCFLFVATE